MTGQIAVEHFPAGLHLLKVEIVNRAVDILTQCRLKQAAAARIMGLSQPGISKMLRGLFRGFNLERLQPFLAASGQDVTIDVCGRSRRKAGSIRTAA